MVAQAIPSRASVRHRVFSQDRVLLLEQQLLQPGEEVEMPMRFIVGRELPKNGGSINLSYALFDITDRGISRPSKGAADKTTAGGRWLITVL